MEWGVHLGKWCYKVWRRRNEEIRGRKATVLDEDEVYDLLLLYRQDFVDAKATGRSTATIQGAARNFSPPNLRGCV